MKRSEVTFFEMQFQKDNYDIITANTEYYTFIGDEKCFKIINVIAPDERNKFSQYVEKLHLGECFETVIRRLDREYPVVACLLPTDRDDVLGLQIFDLDYLYNANSELVVSQNEYEALFELLGVETFVYTPSDDTVSVYSHAYTKKVVFKDSFKAFFELFAEKVTDTEGVNSLKQSIKSGIKNFEYTFEFDANQTLVLGTALFYNGVHIKTVGVIQKLGTKDLTRDTYKKDQLTGVLLKEDITNIARTRVKSEYKDTSIAIIDIDDFKDVNDRFGHPKGDEVLRRCAEIMVESVGDKGYVGRIGGDEFILVLFDVPDLDDRKSILRSIKNSVASAYTLAKDGFQVTTSIGSAHYPGDVDNFEDLYNLSDILVYRAKTMGKNRYATYEYRIQGDAKELLKKGMDNLGVNNRDKQTKAELVCKIADQIFLGEYDKNNITEYLTDIFEEIRKCFSVDRVVVYNLNECKVVLQCGKLMISEEIISETIDYIRSNALHKLYEISTMKGNVIVYNNVMNIINIDNNLYDTLKKQGILSINQHKVKGKTGTDYLVSYEDISLQHTWNADDHHLLRVVDGVLGEVL